jgi:hypothetical protein
MDDDRGEADEAHQNNIPDEAHFQALILHGVAPVLDDDGLVIEPLDVGQRFQENIRFIDEFLHSFSLAFFFNFKPET